MQVEADDLPQHIVVCDIYGSGDALEHPGQDCMLRGGDEHRSHGSIRFHQRPHDERGLGDEEALLGLDPAPERRIREPDVVGKPRIAGVGDANDRAIPWHPNDRTREKP